MKTGGLHPGDEPVDGNDVGEKRDPERRIEKGQNKHRRQKENPSLANKRTGP
jgi:hypothetical protein